MQVSIHSLSIVYVVSVKRLETTFCSFHGLREAGSYEAHSVVVQYCFIDFFTAVFVPCEV